MAPLTMMLATIDTTTAVSRGDTAAGMASRLKRARSASMIRRIGKETYSRSPTIPVL